MNLLTRADAFSEILTGAGNHSALSSCFAAEPDPRPAAAASFEGSAVLTSVCVL